MKNIYINSLLSVLFLFFAASSNALSSDEDSCVYTMYVRTGSIMRAGTNSKISLVLGDLQGRAVWVENLPLWGLMEPKHDYFERGNLDVFSVRAPCIGAPICRLNLTSDGSGHHHGWYCNYVEVTFTGPHKMCRQTYFEVERWLATDVSPYQLTAEIDVCNNSKIKKQNQKRRQRSHKRLDSATLAKRYSEI